MKRKGVLFVVMLLAAFIVGYNPLLAEGNDVLKKCGGCHKNYLDDWMPTKHGKIFLGNPRNDLEAKACEACHGDGTAHIADAKKKSDEIGAKIDYTLIRRLTKESSLTPHEKNEVCLQCHEKENRRALWTAKEHESAGVACVDCHQYRRNILMVKLREALPKGDIAAELCGDCHLQRKAQMQKTSHMPVREGKISCINCHNPHGSAGPHMLKEANINQTCYSCHAEKRGPFLWEHAVARENCSNCHDPHGSNNPVLLKTKGSFLCLQCHQYGGHVNMPRYNRSSNPYGQGCVNCHNRIHGSNHPSGAKFTR